jgi:hypothetical protein
MEREWAPYFKSTVLEKITEEEYKALRHSGLSWVYYPEASGIMKEDLKLKGGKD